MIYRLKFDDRTEFAQAKNHLHLLQSYEAEFEGFQDIEEVEEITDEEAKTIMLKNNDYVEGGTIYNLGQVLSRKEGGVDELC